MSREEIGYEEVRAIIGALPGGWRREADHSDNVFTISRDGAREAKAIWIDGAKVAHDVRTICDGSGYTVLASGRRVTGHDE